MGEADAATDGLGGRLPLRSPSALDGEERQLYDGLTKTILPEAEKGGFVARLEDGRFIGPFNALLRIPAIARGFGQWTRQIVCYGLSEEVRQVVILAVGAAWVAEYELYAHVAAARAEGVSEAAIESILQRTEPDGVGAEAHVAYRLTVAVIERRSVEQDLYDEAVGTFGADGVMAVLSLVGRYQFISSVLRCFKIPTP